jgi:preprotein translocase subunit SecD
MLEFPRWKVWLVSLVVAMGVLLSIPSLIASTEAAQYWPKWLPQYKISLGLDLAGGSHLLLEADARDAQKQRLQAMEDEVTTELKRDPSIDIGDFSTAGGRLSFMVRSPTQVDAAVERMRALTKPVALTGSRDWDVQVVDMTRIVLTPTQSGSVTAMKNAMSVARDVVRRRIDPGGTKEITVVTEGDNRILVQVPGVEDPEALKKLIGQTARLEFKLVDLQANPADVQQGHAPPGSQVLPMADGTE